MGMNTQPAQCDAAADEPNASRDFHTQSANGADKPAASRRLRHETNLPVFAPSTGIFLHSSSRFASVEFVKV